MRCQSRLTLHTLLVGFIVVAAILAAAPSAAQEIGTLAQVAGSVGIERGGTRLTGLIGTPIYVGDVIYTDSGAAVVVFHDVSALTIAAASQVRIDEYGVAADGSSARSVLHLSKGRVRAVVGNAFSQPGSTYEIQTPVAQAGVRGTEFVITYDPVAEVSDIVGLSGTVQVYSNIDRTLRGGVLVNPQEATTVAKADMPTPPRPLPATRLRSYLDGLEFIGGGVAEGLASGVLSGQSVLSPEQAPVAAAREPGLLPYRPNSVVDATGSTTNPNAYTGVDVHF